VTAVKIAVDSPAGEDWSAKLQRLRKENKPMTFEQSCIELNGRIENEMQQEFADAMGSKELPYNEWYKAWDKYWQDQNDKKQKVERQRQIDSGEVSEALEKALEAATFAGHDGGRGGGGGGPPAEISNYPKTEALFWKMWNETAGLDPNDPDEDGLNASQTTYDDAAGWLLVGKGELPPGDLGLALEGLVPIVYFHTPPEKTSDGWVIAGVSGV
jgi:hypothetical protein